MTALATTSAAIGRALSVMDLEQQLAHAERELACADYIDSTDRWQREKAKWRKRVAEIKAQIAEKRRAA